MSSEDKVEQPLPYDVNYLAKKHPVCNEDKIVFEDENHHYKCFNKYFNRWLEKGKMDHHFCIEMQSASSVLSDMFYDSFHIVAKTFFNKHYDRIQSDPTFKFYGCKTPEDVSNVWSAGGTYMHKVYEEYINIYCQELDEFGGNAELTRKYMENLGDYHEMQFLLRFIDMAKLSSGANVCFRTELKMYDPVLNMTGTADLIMKDTTDNKYVIVDWKRSKKALKLEPKTIRTKNPNSFGSYLDSWKSIYNCSFNRYNIQQQIYRYIIEENYGLEIKALFLVVVNPDRRGQEDEFIIKQLELDGRFRKAVLDYTSLRAKYILETVPNIPQDLRVELDKRLVA